MSDFMDSTGQQRLVQLTQEGAVPVSAVEPDDTEADDSFDRLILEITAIRMALTELVNQGSEEEFDFIEQARDYIETETS